MFPIHPCRKSVLGIRRGLGSAIDGHPRKRRPTILNKGFEIRAMSFPALRVTSVCSPLPVSPNRESIKRSSIESLRFPGFKAIRGIWIAPIAFNTDGSAIANVLNPCLRFDDGSCEEAEVPECDLSENEARWRSEDIWALGRLKSFTSAPRNQFFRDGGVKIRNLLVEFVCWLEIIAYSKKLSMA